MVMSNVQGTTAAGAVTPGTVKDRVLSIRREAEGLLNLAQALTGALSPVTRHVPEPGIGGTGGFLPGSAGVRSADPPQRPPQCDIAAEINGTEGIIREVANLLSNLLSTLEV